MIQIHPNPIFPFFSQIARKQKSIAFLCTPVKLQKGVEEAKPQLDTSNLIPPAKIVKPELKRTGTRPQVQTSDNYESNSNSNALSSAPKAVVVPKKELRNDSQKRVVKQEEEEDVYHKTFWNDEEPPQSSRKRPREPEPDLNKNAKHGVVKLKLSHDDSPHREPLDQFWGAFDEPFTLTTKLNTVEPTQSKAERIKRSISPSTSSSCSPRTNSKPQIKPKKKIKKKCPDYIESSDPIEGADLLPSSQRHGTRSSVQSFYLVLSDLLWIG